MDGEQLYCAAVQFVFGFNSLFLSFLLLSLYVIIIIGIIIFYLISIIELFLSQPTSFTYSFLLFLLPILPRSEGTEQGLHGTELPAGVEP